MASQVEQQSDDRQGLDGSWVPLEELLKLPLFGSSKRAFKIRINANFAPRPDQAEPGIKAAVRREYKAGEIICQAGEYGSTAFLLLEGAATAFVPEQAQAKDIPGRSSRSFDWMIDAFRRRTRTLRSDEPDKVEIGEAGRYATLLATGSPPPQALVPGDFFGIDACINFYPREATVRADAPCVVVEMLRSVLDTIRESGTSGEKVEENYRTSAIRNQLRLSPLFRDFDDNAIETLVSRCELLEPDSDKVKDGVLCQEGEAAEAFYLVRAGTIKLSRQHGGGERILEYLGRGAVFGLEKVLERRRQRPLVLACVSHPDQFPPTLLRNVITLGRTDACDVKFPREETAVGRRHCRFEERDGKIVLTDLESANFTIHNGERIQSVVVKAGDRITIVGYEFVLSHETSDPTGATSPILRIATASGLDSFEVVAVDPQAVHEAAGSNADWMGSLQASAQALEVAVAREGTGNREIVKELVDLSLVNSQNTLLIDLDRCTRCDECVKACADAHDGVSRFTRDGPRFGRYLVTMACRSCTDPKCMIGCPVGSIRRRNSLEVHIEDWCIGCERCANQCPFGVINMVERDAAPMAAAGGDAKATPVPLAWKATSCDLCSGYESPNCVYACPHDAAIRVNPTAFLSAADTR